MTSRNIIKALAGMEDLLTGVGTAAQTRNGVELTISKVDIAFAVASEAAMQALDVTKYTRARVYASESNYAEYVYDSASLAGISSDTGPGTWLPAPSFARVLSVEDRVSLRLVEPSFNLQIAVALGATALGVGIGGIYYYDESSVAADDGDDVFVTTGDARWLKLSLESEEIAKATTAGGGANALTASFGLSTVPTDQVFWLRTVFTNTGAATLDIDGLGALPVLFTDGSALIAGAMEANKIYGFLRVADAFILVNPSVSEATAVAGINNLGMMTPLRVEQRLASVLATIADIEIDIAETLATAYGEVISDQTYTASGTWIKPACDPNDTVIAEIWGGGASGALFDNSTGANKTGSGGAGGGYWKAYFRASELSASEAVTIGTGGAAVSGTAETNGNFGGHSRFKDVLVEGGTRGDVFTPSDDPFEIAGGIRAPLALDTVDPIIGSITFAGGMRETMGRGAGIRLSKNGGAQWHAQPGLSCIHGGASGGSVGQNPADPINIAFRRGGYSVFGGDGGEAVSGTGVTAGAGAIPGGGGGAVRRIGGTCTSGAGARGEIRIKVVKGWHPEGFSHG